MLRRRFPSRRWSNPWVVPWNCAYSLLIASFLHMNRVSPFPKPLLRPPRLPMLSNVPGTESLSCVIPHRLDCSAGLNAIFACVFHQIKAVDEDLLWTTVPGAGMLSVLQGVATVSIHLLFIYISVLTITKCIGGNAACRWIR